MKLHTKIFLRAVLAVPLITVGVSFHPHDALADRHNIIEPAASYVPDCPRDNRVCAAWTEFRRARPYPYQTFAIKPLGDSTLAIVISEPSPVSTKAGLEELIKAAFGDDLLALQRLRWKIGIDGWVEDLVLKVKGPSAPTPAKGKTQPDPLYDHLLRDRLALLHLALFGTTYGGQLESTGAAPAKTAKSAAPNLRVSPKEIRDWLTDSATVWRPIEAVEDTSSIAWSSIAAQQAVGTFASEDSSLVMLTFPTEILATARTDMHSLDSLRPDFRQFAVASDIIVGGIWTPNGQTAILARSRVIPLDVLPPLRFETFALLAAQSSDELQQSYERERIFAGKLTSGNYKDKDWAPIYLSEPLIDTEFGALLNITDQMLKSWSEAGTIEYLYFAYPLKPDTFPFKQRPLSDIVKETNGSGSQFVLFNWNTAGSTVITKGSDFTVLAARQTGALPVTYGSNLEPGGDIETGHLVKYEDQAYEYFSGIRDPNLARVIQYTLIYQLFRAIATEGADRQPDMKKTPHKDLVIETRSNSTALLVAETVKLLNELESDKVATDGGVGDKLAQYFQELRAESPELSDWLTQLLADPKELTRKKLREFREQHPEIDTARLARLLADPRSEQSELIAERARLEQDPQLAALFAEWTTIKRLKTQSDVSEQRRRLLLEKVPALRELVGRYELIDQATEVSRALLPVAHDQANLDAVRRDFIALNAAEPDGWIKTPSVVLSWGTQGIGEGGHNLDARALRFEEVGDVSDLALAKTENGLVVRYNPARKDHVEGQATELARAVEHGQMRNVEDLIKIVEKPVETRTRLAALDIPERGVTQPPNAEPWAGQLGTRVYTEKKPFIDDLRNMAENNDCCVFVARDLKQSTYLTKTNPKPPPLIRILEARDTPSLIAYMKKNSGNKDAKPFILLDQPPEHVQALALSLDVSTAHPGKLMQFARWLGSKRMQAVPRNTELTIAHVDPHGRPSSLRVSDARGKVGGRSLFDRLADVTQLFRHSGNWKDVKVSVMELASAKKLVQAAGWNTRRDGVPTAVMMSFGPTKPGAKALDVAVVAGFKRENLVSGQGKLLSAHERSLATVSEEGGTIADYLMNIKNEIQLLPDLEIKRLMGVVKDGETETLFSQQEKSEAIGARS